MRPRGSEAQRVYTMHTNEKKTFCGQKLRETVLKPVIFDHYYIFIQLMSLNQTLVFVRVKFKMASTELWI